MITGVHAIVFSPQADQVREFLSATLGLDSVDAGGPGESWPVYALPPAELAVHPAGQASHQLFLMCDDIGATLGELTAKGAVVVGEVTDRGWGLLAAIALPDGSQLGVYQPRHPSPPRH